MSAQFDFPTETKEINGRQYKVTAFTAKTGVGLIQRLLKVAGPSLAAMFEGSEERNIFDDEGPLTKAVKLLTENLDKDDAYSLLTKLVENTKCKVNEDGFSQIHFDTHFVARYDELFKVIMFVIEVNGFFPQLSALSTKELKTGSPA